MQYCSISEIKLLPKFQVGLRHKFVDLNARTSNKVTPKKSEKRFCTAPEHTFQASLVFAFVKAQYNDVFDVKMRYLTCVSAINGISGTDSFDGDTQTFTSWSSVMSSSTNVAPESEIVPQH